MLFIFYYLYINKVCDVWDNHNPNILKASVSHKLKILKWEMRTRGRNQQIVYMRFSVNYFYSLRLRP